MQSMLPKTTAAVLAALMVASAAHAQSEPASVVNGEVHKNHAVMVDLPRSQHVKNFGAPKFPYSGLCVFASLDMAARWQNCRPLIGIINKIPYGGGWPAKVDGVIAKLGPDVHYYQYQGSDFRYVEQALRSGRAACITYGYSPRYVNRITGQLETISHMVVCVYLDNEWACVLDNNFPGTYEWMSAAEFKKRACWPGGDYWVVVLLNPPPPPVPSN